MPLQSRIARKCNKLTQVYLKGEQLLLEFMIDGKHHTVSILRRGQRSLIDELRSPFCSCASKKRWSISAESMVGDGRGTVNHAASFQEVTMQSPVPRTRIPPSGNRNSTLDFLANNGSGLPPALKRISVISPLNGADVGETITEEEEASELDANVWNEFDESNSHFQDRNTQTTRPVSFDPRMAIQALYAAGRQNSTPATLQLPESLRIGAARPKASWETVVDDQDAAQVLGRRSDTSRETVGDEYARFQDSMPANVRDSMERLGGMARSGRSGYGGF